jgi:hypothetical protein
MTSLAPSIGSSDLGPVEVECWPVDYVIKSIAKQFDVGERAAARLDAMYRSGFRRQTDGMWTHAFGDLDEVADGSHDR